MLAARINWGVINETFTHIKIVARSNAGNDN